VVQRGGQPVRIVRSCRVEVLRGPDAGEHLEITQPRFGIGSHERNEVVLNDATVSRHHLEVELSPFGYRIADLGSSNGTFYGALKLGAIQVNGAVELQLGQTTLRLQPGDVETEVPATSELGFGELVGRSLPMRELFAQLKAVAASDCSVLLEGETGVGKERVAEAIHRASPGARGPFVVVDCGAMSSALMESELFGHVRGAFTGAVEDRKGLIELANGGTLFLDEVGELPLALQAKLLGVLERRRVMPVGTTQTRSVQLRIIAATHRDLLRRANEGQFRADLYYRVAVVRLRVPPLRERMEDLPLLVGMRLAELREREGMHVPDQLSAVALAHLAGQPWPGNVRELFNAVEQAALQLPQAVAPPPARRTAPFFTTREQALDDFNRQYFTALVQRSSNFSQIAREAGLDRRYLQRILDRYGIAFAAGKKP
jgi:transcriptional regulator with GAF, ATPase, and Fis domain